MKKKTTTNKKKQSGSNVSGEIRAAAENPEENGHVDNTSAVTVAELKSEVGSLRERCGLLEATLAQISERLARLEEREQKQTYRTCFKHAESKSMAPYESHTCSTECDYSELRRLV